MSSIGGLVRGSLVVLLPLALSVVPACAGQAGGGTAQNEGGFGAVGTGAHGGAGGISQGGWPEGGPGGSGGTAGASGSGGCVPKCTGKACGPDGCGHVCGHCATNEKCSAQGQCEKLCTPTWETDLSAIPMGATASSSSVYVVGSKNSSAWAASVDACQGNLVKDATLSVSGATSSLLQSVILAGSSLYAVGDVVMTSDPGDALWMRLSPSTLTPLFTQRIYGTTASDEDWSIVQTPSGFWMGATSNVEAGGYGWAIKGVSSGVVCGVGVGGTKKGGIHTIAANGATVYEIFGSGGDLYVYTYDDSCSTTGFCPCSPSATAGPIAVGTTGHNSRSALFEGGNLYVAGFGIDATSTDAFGFVLRLDASGKLLATYRWDPTTLFDAFVSMTTDGKALYVGGAQGWDNSQPTTSSAVAVIQKLPLGFTSSVAPTWIRSLSAYDVAWAVAAQPAASGDGLYVAGERKGAGFVMRCQKSNVCPP